MIFGKGGEYRPRYGLWLDTSPECQAAVQGLLSEGFDCDVVLKWARAPREVVTLSAYMARMEFAGQLEPLGFVGDYVREVFFPQNVALRRREVVNV